MLAEYVFIAHGAGAGVLQFTVVHMKFDGVRVSTLNLGRYLTVVFGH
ncbi:MAG TPA: hypothetical protein VI584_03420 [Nitrospiria bacterium]|nr:hypothetical protein [Nitrospiria bacterium]